MAGVIGCNFFPFSSHPKCYIHIWLCKFVVFRILFYSSGDHGEHLGHYRRQRGSVEKVLIVAHNHPPPSHFEHLEHLEHLGHLEHLEHLENLEHLEHLTSGRSMD